MMSDMSNKKLTSEAVRDAVVDRVRDALQLQDFETKILKKHHLIEAYESVLSEVEGVLEGAREEAESEEG